MTKEEYDDDDIGRYNHKWAIKDISRMEFQANYLASCILLPRNYFLLEFRKIAAKHHLYRHGKALLFVDQQRYNQEMLRIVTGRLVRIFGASRQAVILRMLHMSLLVDKRNSSFKRTADVLDELKLF
ncbi:ImmA/IrrE family metallo-endopeptidase [Deinococcus sp. HMF7604]|uniref:ImmA/IrrE family metallo-endopeptidase n=1 Tax=Deinococcus betulae TaxID=2873312 RepID=UPI001CCC835C|nr:ImmA/IrrE family metallo-endopeptidase [Deinococcus betulae]MBZ9751070.1 ImmA/IrrE family metallo-endopeptidase [Deinococcus betulae]